MKLLVTIEQERLNRNDGPALQFWVTCAFHQLQEDRFAPPGEARSRQVQIAVKIAGR
jgi:hypothetical protein